MAWSPRLGPLGALDGGPDGLSSPWWSQRQPRGRTSSAGTEVLILDVMADTSRDRSPPCGLPGGLGLPAFPLRHGEVKSPMACVPQLLVKKSVEGRDSFPRAGVELRARVTQSGGDQSGVNNQGAPEVAVCCLQSWTVSQNGPPAMGSLPPVVGLSPPSSTAFSSSPLQKPRLQPSPPAMSILPVVRPDRHVFPITHHPPNPLQPLPGRLLLVPPPVPSMCSPVRAEAE